MPRSTDTDEATAETVAPADAPTAPPPDAAHAPTIAPAFAPTVAPLDDAHAPTVTPAFAETIAEGDGQPRHAAELTIVDRAHYDILDEFGRGGLGRVLRARDRRTGRIVAIKEALRSSPALLARFAREALVTANLQHPSIVPVYEVGMWGNGEPFYAMKLVAGRSLAEAVRKAKTLRDRLALLPHLIAVAEALAYAHGQRVIHRDLKPANVLLGDFGETVVIDWGLAKKLDDRDDDDENAGSTMVGVVMGTPGYMAPEQARGEDVDERTDVFAVGAMLYEVLSATRPYSDTDEISAVIDRSGSESPKPLAELNPDAPPELVAITERAMAFDAKHRYPSAKELAEDLRRFETGQLVGAHQYSTWMLVRRWVRRNAAVVAAIAIAVVVLAVVGAYSVARIRTERDAAITAQRQADKEKALAEDRAAALAEEQGRRLAMSGDAARALPYLAAAVDAGRKSPALEFVLGRVLDAIAPIEAVLVGAVGPTNTVSYSPDGTRLVAASEDALRIWDTREHKLVSTIGKGITATWSPDGTYIAVATGDGVAFVAPDGKPLATVKREVVVSAWLTPSPDSKLVAIGTEDGRVMVARLDGSIVFEEKFHDAAVGELEWSTNGQLLVAGSDDGSASVWRATGARIGMLDHDSKVLAVSFSPDGARIATADANGHATTWDAATGKKLVELKGHLNSVEAVDFDASGKYLLTASTDRTAGIWDALTGKRLTTMPLGLGGASSARFAPDGKSVVTVTVQGDMQVWNLDGDPLLTLAGHAAEISMFQFAPDGKQLASCGQDGDVRLWRLDAQPSVVPIANDGTRSWRGEWSPDGNAFAITAVDGVVRIYNGHTGVLDRSLRGHTAEVTRVAFSPDGGALATASVDGTVRIWRGESVQIFDAKAQRARFVAYSHDGKRLASTHDDGTARVWDLASGKQLASMSPVRGKPRTAVWSPDDTRLVTPLDGEGATLWDASGKLLGEATLSGEYTPAAMWNADGSAFVVAGGRSLAAIFDGKTAALRTTLAGHVMGPITSVDISRDGAIVTASFDGVTRLWNATDGKQLRTFGEGTYTMSSALFSPDGKLVVTADLDARVWDVTSGEAVGALVSARNVENSAVSEARWSPDGTRLLVMSLGFAPRLWRVPRWTGTAAELQRRMACTERWKLSSSQLVLTTPDAASCPRPQTAP